jgi:hypothetical protein
LLGDAASISTHENRAPHPIAGINRQLRQSLSDHGDVGGGVVRASVADRNRIANGSPVPPGPRSTNAQTG